MISTDPSITRAARRLRLVTQGAILLLVVVTLGSAALLMAGQAQAGGGVVQIDTAGLPPFPAAFVQLVTGLLVTLALLRLAGMLGKVEAGQPFATAAGLRGFALYLFLAVLASILLPPLIEIAMAALGVGDRRATFDIGGEEILMLFVTGTLFLVARLLDAAQRVADDASQIV